MKLLANASEGKYHLEIDLEHLAQYNQDIHDHVTASPSTYLPLLEEGALDFLKKSHLDGLINKDRLPPVQITMLGALRVTRIRDITASEVGRLLLVPGIVIKAARSRPKAVRVRLKCRKCAAVRDETLPPGNEQLQLPKYCGAGGGGGGNDDGGAGDGLPGGGGVGGGQQGCGQFPFDVMPDNCVYIDQQSITLQEAPECVPMGEMPRTIGATVDRVFADRISPGTRLRLMAIASADEISFGRGEGGGGGKNRAGGSVRTPYLRVVGVIADEASGGRNAGTSFSAEEEARIKALAADPDIFERLALSVAPSIAGDYTDDIKRAILCLLLGGRWKALPDGGRLRGDINVLLLGDPSTAKSQFLKFVERVAPVGVYTSGKGSSAAGLTASVVKDAKGEFSLAGGAMVLADGGVVCIVSFECV